MKRVVLKILFAGFAWTALLISVRAAEEQESTICQLCGMDAAQSETEFILSRKSDPPMHCCCINCARRVMNRLGDDITDVTTLDYRTRQQVPAGSALYVLGSEHIPKGSMTPFVFAFASRSDAEKHQARYGGELIGFKEILERLEVQALKRK